MDVIHKNGESSTSALVAEQSGRKQDSITVSSQLRDNQQKFLSLNSEASGGSSKAVIPHEWNQYTSLPLHPSMDLVSILNLKPQFERFVRPYLPPHILQPDLHSQPNKDDGLEAEATENSSVGKKKKKKDGNARRLEKGYEGIIEECIDPTPLPPSDSLRRLLNGPPAIEVQNVQVRPFEGEQWRLACRLEVGRVKGYSGGEKEGVEQAEAKRKRKKLKKSASLQPSGQNGVSPGPGSPFSPYPAGSVPSAGSGTPRDGLLRINLKTPGTPSYPIQHPQQGLKRARSQSRGPSVSRGASPVGDGPRREGSAGPNGRRNMSQPPQSVHRPGTPQSQPQTHAQPRTQAQQQHTSIRR